MAAQLTLRERNRGRTRQEIETAAFSLFATHGFEGTTVEQIAATAGVSPRTFFRHFPTKEEVVFADHRCNVTRLRAVLAEADRREPLLRRIRGAILAVQDPAGNPRREMTRARLATEAPTVRAHLYQLVEEYETVVVDAVAAEWGSSEQALVRAQILVGAVFGALRGARRATGQLRTANPAHLINDAFDLVERGAAAHLTIKDE